MRPLRIWLARQLALAATYIAPLDLAAELRARLGSMFAPVTYPADSQLLAMLQRLAGPVPPPPPSSPLLVTPMGCAALPCSVCEAYLDAVIACYGRESSTVPVHKLRFLSVGPAVRTTSGETMCGWHLIREGATALSAGQENNR